MRGLIGLYHLDRNLGRLVEFVDSRFGTPESLMLELPVDWREQKDRLTTPNYFYTLAKEYESRGSKIIAGDRNRNLVGPVLSVEFLELEKQIRTGEWHPKDMKEWSRDFFCVLGEPLRYKAHAKASLLSSAKRLERNKGFLEAFDTENPQLTIIGDAHAEYLKSQRTETNYIHFMIDSPQHRLLHMLDSIFWRKTAYDTLQVSPCSKKRYMPPPAGKNS